LEGEKVRLIACSHTGKIGDALYSLPTIRALCERNNAKADFYTTPDCKPMSSLMEYQSCINRVIIHENFVNETSLTDKTKPWRIEFPDLPAKDYEAVYDLSFHSFPDCPLPEFIAKQAGFDYPMGFPIFDRNSEHP
jgi:ADP-heptose:LPS heptosyltransferase